MARRWPRNKVFYFSLSATASYRPTATFPLADNTRLLALLRMIAVRGSTSFDLQCIAYRCSREEYMGGVWMPLCVTRILPNNILSLVRIRIRINGAIVCFLTTVFFRLAPSQSHGCFGSYHYQFCRPTEQGQAPVMADRPRSLETVCRISSQTCR